MASPSCVWCPPSSCWCPPCRLPCGPVEWREWCVLCCPRVWIGSSPSHCLVPLALSVPLVLFLFLFCLVLPCLLWVGKCGGVRWWNCVLFCSVLSCPALLFCLCVCCHSIVGLGWCFCDRVVSLWNSGDGLCWVEGRVVCVMAVRVLSCRIVLWVMEWR